jgi:two-component system, LytTR family, sensor kinase
MYLNDKPCFMINTKPLYWFFFFTSFIIFYIISNIYSTAYSHTQKFAGFFFFLLAAYIITEVNRRMVSTRRNKISKGKSIYTRLLAISAPPIVFTFLFSFSLYLTWKTFLHEQITIPEAIAFAGIISLITIMFILLFEITILNREKQVYSSIVEQLDQERIIAEVNILNNELEPHFIFNSLTALSHLVKHDPSNAIAFTNNLASVYKYFLINKEKDLVPLQDEIDFINSYLFLLKIRFEDAINMNIQSNTNIYNETMIAPCALQILVENAIKHNCFSKDKPLLIKIKILSGYVIVVNKTDPKRIRSCSTRIGLKNLNMRYKIITKQSISIENNNQYFCVKLPLIKR